MIMNTDQFPSNTSTVRDISMQGYQSTLHASAEAQRISDQATQDALWRMAQNNAMAKIKGLNKLCESANQMT